MLKCKSVTKGHTTYDSAYRRWQTHIQRQKAEQWLKGLEKGWKGELLFNGYRGSLWKMKRVL